MCTALEVLEAASRRRLVALLDVVDRAHMLWVEPDGSTEKASQADTRLVARLRTEGLVQLSEHCEVVAYGQGEALGARLLPTSTGLAWMERRHDQAVLAAAAARVRGAA